MTSREESRLFSGDASDTTDTSKPWYVMFTQEAPKKSMLMDMMSMMITVAALLAGFSLGVATSIDGTEVRTYVEWEVAMFVGPNSNLCRGLAQSQPFTRNLPAAMRQCDDNQCWTRGSQWGDHCDQTIDVTELRRQKIDEKIVTVQQQLGSNAMFCIWIESAIVIFGGIMLYSLSCQPIDNDTDGGEHITRWNSYFRLPFAIIFLLTFTGFTNFIMLCSRVIKIKYHFCDDDITDACMVGETLWWHIFAFIVLPTGVITILILHVCVGRHEAKVHAAQRVVS
jgi:hypothetical protein